MGILFGALKAGGFTMQDGRACPSTSCSSQSLIVLFIAAPPLVRAIVPFIQAARPGEVA